MHYCRLYLHQGGPLALQSSTQLNHGGLSFYDMWYEKGFYHLPSNLNPFSARYPVQNQNGAIQVFPSYSSYLFIAEALGRSTSLHISNIFPGRQANGSSITTALGDQSAGQLVAYGFWDTSEPSAHAFPTKLALINLQIFNQTQTGQRPSAEFDITDFRQDEHRPVTIRRLQAPGADVKAANLTSWAGQNFASGVATGALKEENQSSSKISVQASEAVLVIL